MREFRTAGKWFLSAALLMSPVLTLAKLPLDLTVRNRLAEARTSAPVTWSVPLAPEDGLLEPSQLSLLRSGSPVPVQMTPLVRWGGAPSDATRPIAWLLLDFQLDLAASQEVRLQLVRAPRTDPASPLQIARDDASGITVQTGAATYSLSRTSFRLFDGVTLAGGTAFTGGGGISYGGALLAGPATITVEHRGPQRISLLARGTVSGDLEYTLRLHFYKNLAEVRADFRLENLSGYAWRDLQPDCNAYGTQGSVAFDDLSLVFPGSGARDYRYPSGELGGGTEVTGTYSTGLALVQESSGDPNWNVLLTEAPRLQSGAAKRASTVRLNGAATDGPNQIAGWLDSGGVTAAVESCWQNFPKALRAAGGALEIGLFPGEFARNHELRAGEFKTHTVWVRHHASADSDAGGCARSALAPLRLLASAEDLADTRAAGLFAPRMHADFPEYELGVDYQITESPNYQVYPWQCAAPTVLDSISLAQLFGWVDYGDTPTDFEPFGPAYVQSAPFNTKYDGVRGAIYQALRTGDETWWELAASGARHSADIDLLHTRNRGRTAAREWPDGGMYGHGYHDERGNVNPHRNYSNPNLYVTGAVPGMFLWAHLTGDTLLLDSAAEASENFWWRTVNSSYPDDGGCAGGLRQCTTEPWTCNGWADVDGNRTGGDVVKTLLSAYFATGDAAYLDAVSQIAAYLRCYESAHGVCCNRYHFQGTFVRNLGHYILFRRWLGLAEDATAVALLRSRVDYQVGHLWDGTAQTFSMCYDCASDPDWEDCNESHMCPIYHNWLLVLADTFGAAALVFDDPAYLTTQGRPLLEYGCEHPMGSDSLNAYHFSKEYVNQVGFGNVFLYAWRHFYGGGGGCYLGCSAAAASPAGSTVQFTASANPSGCTGSPAFAWSFGDGQTSSEQNPSHVYAADGTYAWTLTATADTATCTRSGSVTIGTVVTPPAVASMTRQASPFRIRVDGSGFQSGLRVYINGTQWAGVSWKRDSRIVLTGGSSLKAAVPRGVSTLFRFVNPDGGEATLTWSW